MCKVSRIASRSWSHYSLGMGVLDSGADGTVPMKRNCVFYLWGIRGHMLVPMIKSNGNLLISLRKNVLAASYVLDAVLCAWATVIEDTAT